MDLSDAVIETVEGQNGSPRLQTRPYHVDAGRSEIHSPTCASSSYLASLSPDSQHSSPNKASSQIKAPICAHKTLESVQTITSPPDKDTPLQAAMALDQTGEVRTYLKDRLAGQYFRFPERPREFIVSKSPFCVLLEDPEFESDRNRARLKISYDAYKSVLTLFPMPGSRHARVVDWLAQLALMKLNPSVQEKLITLRGEDVDYEGEYEGSKKEPDLGIAWIEDDGGYTLNTVVEVGVSQPRKNLLDARDIYLKGLPEVSRYISLNVVTTPEYTSPEKLNIEELKDIQKTDFQLDSDQGPLWYKNVQWVGKSTLVWEVWEREPESEEPEQVFNGVIDPDDSETELPFFKIPTRIAAGVEAVTIKQADIPKLWCHWWKHAIINEAVKRMRRYVTQVEQRRKHAIDVAEQEDERAKKRQTANEERTECWKRRSER